MASYRARERRLPVLITMACLLISGGLFAQPPGRENAVHNLARAQVDAITPPDAPAIFAVLVTDLDPMALAERDRIVIRASRWTGPFDAKATAQLQVFVVLDRRLIGEAPFDLITSFRLPDGSLYQKRVLPVDPNGESEQRVRRSQLAPLPVRLAFVRPLGVLSRVIPSEDMRTIDPSVAVFTPVSLPVSGTWITQHNLYGDWSVEVALRRGRKIFATRSTNFHLLR